MIWIEDATYLGEYRIRLKFNTAEEGDIDLRDVVYRYAAAEPLRQLEAFQRFYLDGWPTLAWRCGFDMAPEWLYEMATGKKPAWSVGAASASRNLVS